MWQELSGSFFRFHLGHETRQDLPRYVEQVSSMFLIWPMEAFFFSVFHRLFFFCRIFGNPFGTVAKQFQNTKTFQGINFIEYFNIVMQHSFRSSTAFHNKLEILRYIKTPMKPYGAPWSPMKPYGVLWSPTEPCEFCLHPDEAL